ncbi:hypothetical protein BV210_07675 [Halorientalis sp. IM1011]|uniref:DUF6653 family protein n=1 Tax=Halorientalis sp. IM1011 TaxID=1932360 RepID=UPI00097CCD5A|nr:DUF6653 family protein [Halorientalis sp. IM1011]AQL42594.1 hypothetical protein BV210_07675 [Halorientalis sp. IM1011]
MSQPSRLATLREAVWERHANPASGWSRVLSLPLLMLAIYRRDERLLVGTVLFVAVNPVLFPPPEDDDAWMSRVVYGERLWLEHGNRRHPIQLLNVANAACTIYAVRAAVHRQPLRTALATGGAMALKFLFVAFVADYYDRHAADVTPE